MNKKLSDFMSKRKIDSKNKINTFFAKPELFVGFSVYIKSFDGFFGCKTQSFTKLCQIT